MSKIGVFDSGLGGLSVLKEMMRVLPNEDFLFYEDSLNNPYGVKDEEELLEITSKIVDYLLDHDCKIIVIACNTATTCCMKALREKYPDTIFVGTVPAIKVAYDNNYKNTIILSTPYTTKSKRVEELLNDYTREDQIIINISGENLANLIELDKHDEIMKLLHRLLDDYKDKADSLALGCTHYSLIKAEINEVLPNTVLLDGCLGVANEVKHQLEEHGLLESNNGSLEIINSKSNDLIKRSYEILEN